MSLHDGASNLICACTTSQAALAAAREAEAQARAALSAAEARERALYTKRGSGRQYASAQERDAALNKEVG